MMAHVEGVESSNGFRLVQRRDLAVSIDLPYLKECDAPKYIYITITSSFITWTSP